MIKNLVVSGCSFTAGKNSWARCVQDQLSVPNLFNVGSIGAGNRYIASSIIDVLQHHCLAPKETVILAMWSGPGRVDELVSGEYWYLLEDYPYKTFVLDCDDTYWIHSGGRGNSWLDHQETKKLFQHKYVTSDPFVLCKETLVHMSHLQNFLQNHGFRYKFMSYVNYWIPDKESVGNGDFSLTHFCSDWPTYRALEFQHWIFVNQQKDSLYEFCAAHDCVSSDNFHPTSLGHQQFAQQIILPQLDFEYT